MRKTRERKRESESSLDDMNPEDLLNRFAETRDLITNLEAEKNRLRDELAKVADRYQRMTGELAVEADDMRRRREETPDDAKIEDLS